MHSFTYTCLRQRLQLGQDHVGWLDISMDHALRVDVDLGTDGLPKAPGENLLEKMGCIISHACSDLSLGHPQCSVDLGERHHSMWLTSMGQSIGPSSSPLEHPRSSKWTKQYLDLTLSAERTCCNHSGLALA